MSDGALLNPHERLLAAVGAMIHLGRAWTARAKVAARRGEVRLGVRKAHDARSLAAER